MREGNMRWSIIRTLLHKEVLRQLANRGGIALAALLVVASLLLSLFRKEGGPPGSLMGGVDSCFLDYWQEDPWIEHLRRHVPENLAGQLTFRNVSWVGDETLTYPPGSGAIQVRPSPTGQYKICVWHPGRDASSLAVYETWFWRESACYFQRLAQERQGRFAPRSWFTGDDKASSAPTFSLQQERAQLKGGVDMRSSVTTGLVLFALFFACVYLLPSFMCEERERGVLLAQALSPASPLEILAAKFLFYPVMGIGLAALLGGINKPAVLAVGWTTLAAILFRERGWQ
jgi:hypothetical protein